MDFLKNPAQMTLEELEQEYAAIKDNSLNSLLEDNKVNQEIKNYFRQHALNVELEYILRKVKTSYE